MSRTHMSRAHMCRAQASQWGARLLAFGLGALAALLVLADDIASWWTLRTEVLTASERALPAPHQAAPQAAAEAASDAASAALAAPTNGLAWLPVLQTYGLQLQALQHSAAAAGGTPAELSLTVQGRWRDWLALERHATVLLTGWLPQSWQVQALGPPAPDGQVQLQWRLRPSGAATPALDNASELVARDNETHVASTDAEVFAAATALRLAPATTPAKQQGPATNKAPWRLLGVWQQAGLAHALAEGEGQVHALTPGQKLGRSGLRVQRIEDGQVWVHGGPSARAARPWLMGSAP